MAGDQADEPGVLALVDVRRSMACRRSSRSGENPSASGVDTGSGWATAGPAARKSAKTSDSRRQMDIARDSIKQPDT